MSFWGSLGMHNRHMGVFNVSDAGVSGVVASVRADCDAALGECASALGRARESTSRLDGAGVGAVEEFFDAVDEMTEIYVAAVNKLADCATQSTDVTAAADMAGKASFMASAPGGV